MKKLTEMTLNEKIDAMKAVIEQAEIDLSKKQIPYEELEEIDTILSDVHWSIKEQFFTGDTITTPDGAQYPTWNGDAFDEALNSRHPGLSFRMNSVMNALEDLFAMFGEF